MSYVTAAYIFVLGNPCQFSPSLPIRVLLRFKMLSLVFIYLSKLLFSGFLFNIKVILHVTKILTELLNGTKSFLVRRGGWGLGGQ